MSQTLFTLTTTGERGEVIGTPSFLVSDRGYAMDGQDALTELLVAVNRWFRESDIEGARAEASYAGKDYDYGDLLSGSRVLSGLAGYGIDALDDEVPAGGPYHLATAVESHHTRLLTPETRSRLWPEEFEG